MAVKNIHTRIAPEKTITEIIKLLTQFGAKKILQDLDNSGNIVGVSFLIELQEKAIPIRLPMKVDKARAIIEQAVEERKLTKKFLYEPERTEQALRVGWRIIKDWVHSQLSLVQMNYAEPIEIFLSYVYDIKTEKTVYEQMLEGKLKTLALEHETKS